MAEPEVEPAEVLRRTRIETLPYLRDLARRNRAIIPRIEVARRWMDYYKTIQKTRPLTKREQTRLDEHRKLFNVYSDRREVLRRAGQYGRTHKPPDLIALRQAQARYYEAKMETLPPEQAKRIEEQYVPPKEQYDEWAGLQQDIEAKCKQYQAVKLRVDLPIVERHIRMRVIGEELRADYARASELGSAESSMSELVKEYREMKERGRPARRRRGRRRVKREEEGGP